MAITFELGRIVATKRVWELIDTDERFSRFVTGCLSRYIVYDWGELDPEDWKMNDEAVKAESAFSVPIRFRMILKWSLRIDCGLLLSTIVV